METAQTQQIVQQFMQYLTTRDLDKLTALFSENVDWYIPGDENAAPWTGRRHTRQDIKTFYELLWSQTVPVSAKIDIMMVEDNRAIVAGEFSTQMLSTDRVVDSLFSIWISVEDHLITRYRLLEDSYAVSQSLQAMKG